MARYSLDLVLPPAISEGRFALLGAVLGALLSGILYRTGTSGLGFLTIEVIEFVLYGGIIGTALALSVISEKRYLIRYFMSAGLGLIAILFYWNALELFWSAPERSYFLIGGLVPSSDADSWVSGGWRILETELLSEGDQRRPINAGLFALRLYIAGSFQGSLMLGAIVCAAASLYAAYALKSSVGWPGAVTFLFFAFWLIQEHLPLAMTEVHGFIFGCLALGCLWQAALTRSSLLFFLGLALLSIGLNARSGPFFVLPALLCWGIMNFGGVKRLSLKVLFVGTLAILSGFLMSIWVGWLWGSEKGTQQANFALTLYGMAVGGKGWLQAFSDFPEILGGGFGSGNEAYIARFLYAESLKEIIGQPYRFIEYFLKELWEFFSLFLRYDLGVSRIAMALAGFWILIRWRDRLSQMAVLMFVGIWCSSPFLMDDAGVRPFAPVFAVFASIPAVAVGLVWRTILKNKIGALTKEVQGVSFLSGNVVIVSLFLVSVILGPVVSVWAYQNSPNQKYGECPDGFVSVETSAYLLSYVNVVDNDDANIRVPEIRYDDFLRTFPRSQGQPARKQVTEMSPPFTLVSGMNTSTESQQIIWIKGKLDLAPREGASFCVDVADSSPIPNGTINPAID